MKKILLSVVTTFLCLSTVFALDLPSGYVSIYSLVAIDSSPALTELCPQTIGAGLNSLILGPASGWGQVMSYDLSSYKQLVFKVTYPAITADRQVAVRLGLNGAGSAVVVLLTLPKDSTTKILSIPLDQYKATDGSLKMGGINFYDGASHWSFTYTGTASDAPVTLNYVAVTQAGITTGLTSTINDNPNAIVNVFNLTGVLVRKDIKRSEATLGLKTGVYIINKNKVVVTKE
jgi:hypothetical protein